MNYRSITFLTILSLSMQTLFSMEMNFLRPKPASLEELAAIREKQIAAFIKNQIHLLDKTTEFMKYAEEIIKQAKDSDCSQGKITYHAEKALELLNFIDKERKWVRIPQPILYDLYSIAHPVQPNPQAVEMKVIGHTNEYDSYSHFEASLIKHMQEAPLKTPKQQNDSLNH